MLKIRVKNIFVKMFFISLKQTLFDCTIVIVYDNPIGGLKPPVWTQYGRYIYNPYGVVAQRVIAF